ncbi:MAG TPA: Rv2578c family radical SAM protein [Pseudonocardiaceae bacterium]|nr:Rv2578c family radical SAM protein [Pseudonocardiaceae bacterium]
MFDYAIVRWQRQRIDQDALLALPGMPGLLRSVRTPEFAGMVFHEVAARSALNRVPSSWLPFDWTVNPYRGCGHACAYCFARNSHTYLDFDAGRDFDSQVVVKVNAAEVLDRELRSPRWNREHVAMGTNTDPYQRAEGRYRLMPGIIDALVANDTPFSVLTKGTLLARDLPLLVAAAERVEVRVGVSIAMIDHELSASVEPGTPSPRARIELVRKITDAGLRCGVMVAPVLPGLSDSVEQLDALFGELAAAGANGVTAFALHLRPGAREWYLRWLAREHPELVPRYEALYARGANAGRGYRNWLARQLGPLLRKHGLDRASGGGPSSHRPQRPAMPPPPRPAMAEQPTLL